MNKVDGIEGIPSPRLKPGRSLVRQMLLTLLPIVLASVLLLGSLSYLRARRLIQDQASVFLSGISEGQSAQIDSWFERLGSKLSLITLRPALLDSLEELRIDDQMNRRFSDDLRNLIFSELETANQPDLLFNQFILTTPDGRVLMASERGWEGYELGETAFFKALTPQKSSLIALNPEPLFMSSVVSMSAAPILDESDAWFATLIGINGPAGLQSVLENAAAFHPQARPYLLSAGGRLIGLDPSIKSMTKIAELDASTGQEGAFQDFMDRDQTSGTLSFTSFDGVPVIASLNHLTTVDEYLMIEIPEDTVLSGLTGLSTFLILAVMITAVLLAFLIWLGTRNAIRPLQGLTEAIQRFSPGNPFHPVPEDRRDEIGVLSKAFNRMAEEISSLYTSLEQKVDSRSRQIRATAEIAQVATIAGNENEILQQTIQLIVEKFEFYHVSIFLLDSNRKYAVLRESSGTAGAELKTRGHRFAVGSNSVVGWVTANNRARVVTDKNEDPFQYRNELIPHSRSEAGVPISARGEILGALDVHSTDPDTFDIETVTSLQILADQIAAAIQNVKLLEAAQIDLKELNLLYRAGRDITWADTEDRVFRAVGEALKTSSYSSAFFRRQDFQLSLIAGNLGDGEGSTLQETEIPNPIELSPDDPGLNGLGGNQALILDPSVENDHYRDYQSLGTIAGWVSMALIPIKVSGELSGILLLGSKTRNQISQASVAPYSALMQMVGYSLEKVRRLETSQSQGAHFDAIRTIIADLASGSMDQINFETNLSTVTRRLRRSLSSDIVAIYLTAPDPGSLELKAAANKENLEISQTIIPVGFGPIGEAASQKETITKTSYPPAGVAGPENDQPVTEVAFPIVFQNSSLGVLYIRTREAAGLSNIDIDLLAVLCSTLAGHLANFQILERQRILYEVTAKLSQSTSVEMIMKTTLHELSGILGARKASITIGSSAEKHSNGGMDRFDLT